MKNIQYIHHIDPFLLANSTPLTIFSTRESLPPRTWISVLRTSSKASWISSYKNLNLRLENLFQGVESLLLQEPSRTSVKCVCIYWYNHKKQKINSLQKTQNDLYSKLFFLFLFINLIFKKKWPKISRDSLINLLDPLITIATR